MYTLTIIREDFKPTFKNTKNSIKRQNLNFDLKFSRWFTKDKVNFVSYYAKH